VPDLRWLGVTAAQLQGVAQDTFQTLSGRDRLIRPPPATELATQSSQRSRRSAMLLLAMATRHSSPKVTWTLCVVGKTGSPS
jgi:hypothetical protein